MDWGKVIAAANLGVNIYTAGEINRLQNSAEREEKRRIAIENHRRQIFEFRQHAETVISGIDQNRLIATAAIRILEQRMILSGLTPDSFSELSDKEYVMNVIKLVRGTSTELMAEVTSDERVTVNRIVEDVMRLPDYSFYLATYPHIQRAKEAKSIIAQLEGRNGCLVKNTILVVELSILIYFFGFVGSLSALGNLSQFILLIVGGSLIAVGAKQTSNWMNPKGLKDAKEQLQRIEKAVDVKRFDSLTSEFRTLEEVQRRQQESQMRIRQFFGDEKMLLS